MHAVQVYELAEHVGTDRSRATLRTATIRVNARIITATHRDIEGKVQTESFRQDLYYRLYGIRILLPSLDECPSDIASLAIHFWREIMGNPAASLSDAVCATLESMSWPGNGRQLKALLKRVRHLFGTDDPCPEHFNLLASHEGNGKRPSAFPQAQASGSVQMECLTHLRRTATALHSLELVLKRLKFNPAPARPEAVLSETRWANLRMSAEEIRSLCCEPLLFASEALFRKVEGIVEALDAMDGTADATSETDGSNSAHAIREHIQSAMHDVFAATQTLISAL